MLFLVFFLFWTIFLCEYFYVKITRNATGVEIIKNGNCDSDKYTKAGRGMRLRCLDRRPRRARHSAAKTRIITLFTALIKGSTGYLNI